MFLFIVLLYNKYIDTNIRKLYSFNYEINSKFTSIK